MELNKDYTPQLTKATKERWLMALKSGNYKHTQGKLRKEGNEMCCLGVLCDIIDPDKWQGDEWMGMDSMPPANIFDSDAAFFQEEGEDGIFSSITLYEINDRKTTRSYDPVIPFIEQLPTID